MALDQSANASRASGGGGLAESPSSEREASGRRARSHQPPGQHPDPNPAGKAEQNAVEQDRRARRPHCRTAREKRPTFRRNAGGAGTRDEVKVLTRGHLRGVLARNRRRGGDVSGRRSCHEADLAHAFSGPRNPIGLYPVLSRRVGFVEPAQRLSLLSAPCQTSPYLSVFGPLGRSALTQFSTVSRALRNGPNGAIRRRFRANAGGPVGVVYGAELLRNGKPCVRSERLRRALRVPERPPCSNPVALQIRSSSPLNAVYSESTDGGATWSSPVPIFPAFDASTRTAIRYPVTQPNGSTLNAPAARRVDTLWPAWRSLRRAVCTCPPTPRTSSRPGRPAPARRRLPKVPHSRRTAPRGAHRARFDAET